MHMLGFIQAPGSGTAAAFIPFVALDPLTTPSSPLKSTHMQPHTYTLECSAVRELNTLVTSHATQLKPRYS